ncbi:unnamed protein product [Urochloa humidicola]
MYLPSSPTPTSTSSPTSLASCVYGDGHPSTQPRLRRYCSALLGFAWSRNIHLAALASTPFELIKRLLPREYPHMGALRHILLISITWQDTEPPALSLRS